MRVIKLGLAGAAVLFAIAAESQAGMIIGGSDLLTSAYHSQLETWLGENVNLTNIFDKTSGDTSVDFHAAVDGKGRTFSIIEVVDALGGPAATADEPMIIGGYNPYSWNSSDAFHVTVPGDRNAFIFNLSTSTVLYQNPTDSYGAYQTYNLSNQGPRFGYSADDLAVLGDLTNGATIAYSYGVEDGAISFASNSLAGYGLTIGQIEVFAISSAPVPEPSSIVGTLSLIACGAVVLRRRRAKKLAA